jgi:hypothetical protein
LRAFPSPPTHTGSHRQLHALAITRWKHSDPSIKEPVHLSFAIDLSQLSFFQRGTVKEIGALVLRTCVAKTNPGDYQVPRPAACVRQREPVQTSGMNGRGRVCVSLLRPLRVLQNLLVLIVRSTLAAGRSASWAAPLRRVKIVTLGLLAPPPLTWVRRGHPAIGA